MSDCATLTSLTLIPVSVIAVSLHRMSLLTVSLLRVPADLRGEKNTPVVMPGLTGTLRRTHASAPLVMSGRQTGVLTQSRRPLPWGPQARRALRVRARAAGGVAVIEG